MLRSAGPLLLLLLAAATAQPDCDLSHPDKLNDCVKQLLVGLRSDVRNRTSPLRLDDEHDCSGLFCHTLSDIFIHGLDKYEIRHLNVSFPPPEGTRLSVQATIGWQRLSGNLHARLTLERRIFGKRIRAASASGDIELQVENPQGSLDVTIEINVHGNGSIAAKPVSTEVSVSLGDIDVDVRLSTRRWLRRLIKKPTNWLAELVAKVYWARKWRSKLERRAKKALKEAIVEKLGVQLSDLLHN